ncbi:MAG: peptidoglycan editing factor PgeF [Lachnospiraceae bacterium]|nr:peptidoglycan editing factor PgeF [Lachnospiraceae bacterium]MDD6617622.1 peptidoglycan editing factor PgeF [Clostridiales bacterium]
MEIKWNDSSCENMNVRKNGEVVYLTFPALERETAVYHGFSTRFGGVSEGIYHSMNLSFTRGDQEEAVKENFCRISSAIGFPSESIVTSDQTHTTNVRVVTEEDRGCGITKPRSYTDVDGMVTNVPGLTLATFYADCVPLYFYDPVHRAIGLSHSGWRGTVGKIGKVTVETMARVYGTKPEDVLAAIGPSICQECYEVSADVIEQFRGAFEEKDWNDLFYAKENGKYQLNLWKANEKIFLEAGILPEHISLSNLCTCCNPKFLFSHRASHGKRGNLAAFLGIQK